MSEKAMELVRGSGNVFFDLGQAQADVRQLKATLAAEIVEALNAVDFRCARRGPSQDG